MLRRTTTVVALAVLAALSMMSPARADHDAAHTIAQMTAHYQDPALETQNKPFALLYLRTTEGMRDANNEGEFSDPEFWDQEVIPTFASYYLDAYKTWKSGDENDVDVAWRIAFRTRPVVYPEIQRDLCPGLFSETIPATADRDIFAWRQLAWDNAQRLTSAPTPQAREAVASEIRQHAQDKARKIIRWYR